MDEGRRPFDGQAVLITAAAGEGLGQALARRFAEGGASVAVTDRHAGRTAEVAAAIAEETGQAVIGISFDVEDLDAAEAVVEEASRRLGPIRVLVNNAAVNIVGDIFDYDTPTFERLMRANLTTPWHLAKLVFPQMRDAGGGSLLAISSVAGATGGSQAEPPYAAAKAALHELTRGFARAGGPHNVRANAITMGVVTGTRFIDVLHPEIAEAELPKVPLGRHATVDDITNAALFLSSDRAAFITGEILNVAGGAYLRTG